MQEDLGTLRGEIEEELSKRSFAVYRGRTRNIDARPVVEWDAAHRPDFREFLAAAESLGVRLLVFHEHSLSEELLESADEKLQLAELPQEEGREYEAEFVRLRNYVGFVCSIQLSFDYEGLLYLFEVSTPWYSDLLNMMDELDDTIEQGPDEESLGGYYSQN